MNLRPDDGDDLVDTLLAACLDEPARTRGTRLAELCAQHPAHADALRRRHAFLVEAGLVDDATALAAALPERIGAFRILRLLGHGGMGVVYLAEQESLGRKVALKLVQPGALAPPRARERFRRELQAVALLDHPNICPVFDAGEVEGVPYLALRYVDGETMAERLARAQTGLGRAPAAADPAAAIDGWVDVGIRVARALHAAHEHGLVHRDVKPGNVMIEAATQQPLLLDFGLAQLDDPDVPTLTRSGDRIGTPAYMAPEQVAGLPVDRRTDVYGLGATLYEALTGHVPHQAPTLDALYRRILTADVSLASRHNPRISRDLEVVLATALDRDANRRYRTAAELADDLQRVRDRKPILARRPGAWVRARRWCQRNPYAATTLGVLAAGLVAAAVLLDLRADALAARDVELMTRRSFDVLRDDPCEALELAWQAVQLDRSPATMKALRAAVHVPQVEVEIESPGRVDTTFAWSPGTSHAELRLAWTERYEAEGWRLCIWRRGAITRVPLPGQKGWLCTRFSPDGRQLVVAGSDAPTMVYDCAGALLHTLPHPQDAGEFPYVHAVAWHPHRNLLAIGIGDGKVTDQPVRSAVHLFDLDAGGDDKRIRSHDVGAWPQHLAFTADGDHLIAAPGCGRFSSRASFRDHAVRAFPVAGGETRRHDHHRQPCLELAVSGNRVATVGHDGQLVLWDLESERPIVALPHPGPHPRPVFTVDVSPDGGTLATACQDGFVRMFDWKGTMLAEWATHGFRYPEVAAFHPDGRMLLVQHQGGRSVCTLDGRVVASLPSGHGTVRREFFVGPDHLITADFTRIRLWRLWPEGLRPRVWAKGKRPVLSRAGNRLALAGFDGVVMTDWADAETWTHAMPPVNLTIDEQGSAYQATDDRRLLIVGPDGEPQPTPAASVRPLERIGCAPEGGLVAASENTRNVVVFRRKADASWARVDAKGLPAPPGKEASAQRALVWLAGPDQGRRILAPTHDGLVELTFAGDRLAVAGTYLREEVINRLAVTADEQTLALYSMGRCLHRFERDGWRWRERQPRVDVGVDNVGLAFDGANRLLLTLADEVRVLDRDGLAVDSIPSLGEVRLIEGRSAPAPEKIVTIAADFIAREHWTDFDRVTAEAQRLLALRARRQDARHRATTGR